MKLNDLPLIHRPCPFCQNTKKSRIILRSNLDNTRTLDNLHYQSRGLPNRIYFQQMFCSNCDVIYASPSFKKEIIEKLYQKATEEDKKLSYIAAQKYEKILHGHMKNIKKIHSALDIGTGSGAFLEVLEKIGFKKIIGIGPTSNADNNTQVKVIKSTFKSKLFLNRHFDFISCILSFEHFFDPHIILHQIKKIMLPGSVLFIVFHDWSSLINRILRKKSPLYDIQHLQLFSQKSVIKIMAKEGFKIIDLDSFTNTYPISYWLRLSPIPPKITKIGQGLLTKLNLNNLPIPFAGGNFYLLASKI